MFALRQNFGPYNSTLISVCVFNDDVGDQIWHRHLFVFVLQLLHVVISRLRKLFYHLDTNSSGKTMLSALISFKQILLFVYLNFYVFAFNHLPIIVVSDHEPLSNDVFNNVFKDNRISNIFCFLVRAISIGQITR